MKNWINEKVQKGTKKFQKVEFGEKAQNLWQLVISYHKLAFDKLS